MPGQPPDFQKGLQSIERLLVGIEEVADPNIRSAVQELVQLIMNLHGAGIERMLELIRATTNEDVNIIPRLAKDDLVGSLLVLYGLHPVDLETRIAQAVDKAKSRLRAHEGELEILSVQDGAVRLRLHANGHGCGSNPQALKEIVEDAIYQTAPDITSLDIQTDATKQSFVPLEMLLGAVR